MNDMKLVKLANTLTRDLEKAPERLAELPFTGYRYGLDAPQEEGQLRDYWRAIYKRKSLVIGVVVLLTVLATIYTIQKPNEYEAQARVQVDLERVNPALGASKDSPIIVGNATTDLGDFNIQVHNFTVSKMLLQV